MTPWYPGRGGPSQGCLVGPNPRSPMALGCGHVHTLACITHMRARVCAHAIARAWVPHGEARGHRQLQTVRGGGSFVPGPHVRCMRARPMPHAPMHHTCRPVLLQCAPPSAQCPLHLSDTLPSAHAGPYGGPRPALARMRIAKEGSTCTRRPPCTKGPPCIKGPPCTRGPPRTGEPPMHQGAPTHRGASHAPGELHARGGFPCIRESALEPASPCSASFDSHVHVTGRVHMHPGTPMHRGASHAPGSVHESQPVLRPPHTLRFHAPRTMPTMPHAPRTMLHAPHTMPHHAPRSTHHAAPYAGPRPSDGHARSLLANAFGSAGPTFRCSVQGQGFRDKD